MYEALMQSEPSKFSYRESSTLEKSSIKEKERFKEEIEIDNDRQIISAYTVTACSGGKLDNSNQLIINYINNN